MSISSLKDLFTHLLKDTYYAENEVSKELPKMAKKAGSKKLENAFKDHHQETKGQIERLEQVFDSIGVKAKGEKCEAINGILKEATSLLDEVGDAKTRDVALIASAQAVEHYEINRYGTLITWAEQLGMDDAVRLLRINMKQEKQADRHLSELADTGVNQRAAA